MLSTTPARRLRDALEPIATQGFWSPAVHERLAAHGIGVFEGYVWGRAAALGTPAASVVVAAFGVFEPKFLTAAYERGRAQGSREAVLEARAAGASAGLAALLDEDVRPLADELLAAVMPLDGTARPLFSGVRELPVPDDPHGRLWRAADLVREHRGDSHLAACVAAGLDPVSMNVLTELWTGYRAGEYVETRGWGPDVVAAAVERLGDRGWVADGQLTEAGTIARLAIEDATDLAQHDLVVRLGDRIEALIERLQPLADRIVAAGDFPADPRKRAAG
jgi:hypothetical protein